MTNATEAKLAREAEMCYATIAMVTTGGLVRKGNPDKQVAANATRYHRHSVKSLEALTPEGWEAYHYIMQYEGDRSAEVK